MAIVGGSARQIEERELCWLGEMRPVDGKLVAIRQRLSHVTARRDGSTIVDADVPDGTCIAELLVDHDGKVVSVSGSECAGKTPPMDAIVRDELSPEALKSTVAIRYELLVGRAAGKPTVPGTTWSVPGPEGETVKSRSGTVEKVHACVAGGTTTCVTLRVDYDLDPRGILRAAGVLAREALHASGEDASGLEPKASTYALFGSSVIEPATMLIHGAELAERGRVTMSGPARELEVELRGTSTFTYHYVTERRTPRPRADACSVPGRPASARTRSMQLTTPTRRRSSTTRKRRTSIAIA